MGGTKKSRNEKRGQATFSSGLLGLHCRIVNSNPSVVAILACQPSLPNGCRRFAAWAA